MSDERIFAPQAFAALRIRWRAAARAFVVFRLLWIAASRRRGQPLNPAPGDTTPSAARCAGEPVPPHPLRRELAVEALFEPDRHRVADVFTEKLAHVGLDRQLVTAVAERHERAAERKAV